MNIFKKTVACLAAASVMTSMAVTASAEYKVSGVNGNDGKYYLRIVGLPEEISNDTSQRPVAAVAVNFEKDGLVSIYQLGFQVFNRNNETICQVMDAGGTMLEELNCNLLSFEGFNGELGFLVEFPAHDQYLTQFMGFENAVVSAVAAGYYDYDADYNITGSNFSYYSSNGQTVDMDYVEKVTATWQEISKTDTSEPTSSDPASEPTSSEPASSEPVSEPAASEPVSSEPTASQPSNVDTGTAGIAAVFGTAVLAAGAVIVTRKKK